MKRFFSPLIIVLATLSVACSTNTNATKTESVSLIDYINAQDLERYGFSQAQLNQLFANDGTVQEAALESLLGKHYVPYHTNGFTILSSEHHPSHIFIIKDGKFIAQLDDTDTVLYGDSVNIPAINDELIRYRAKDKQLTYHAGDLLYEDFGVDGIDITSQIMPYPDTAFEYFATEGFGLSHTNIIDANVADKQCRALAGNFACCLSSDTTYMPHRFTITAGWQRLPDNRKLKEICNSDHFEADKQALIDTLFNTAFS